MLQMKVIELAKTEWAVPIVFAPNKYGSHSFGVDYRKLNLVTERDFYPILRGDECIGSLGDELILSTFGR